MVQKKVNPLAQCKDSNDVKDSQRSVISVCPCAQVSGSQMSTECINIISAVSINAKSHRNLVVLFAHKPGIDGTRRAQSLDTRYLLEADLF